MLRIKGYRTLILNGVIAGATAILAYAAGINWVEYVGDTWAVVIVTGVNAIQRIFTTTPLGKST